MSREDERASVVHVLEVMVEGGEDVLPLRAVLELVQLVVSETLHLEEVGLSVERCEDVRGT